MNETIIEFSIMDSLMIISLSVSVIFGIYFALDISNKNTVELLRVSECIVAEANRQQYAGNPYNQEAWELFASECE